MKKLNHTLLIFFAISACTNNNPIGQMSSKPDIITSSDNLIKMPEPLVLSPSPTYIPSPIPTIDIYSGTTKDCSSISYIANGSSRPMWSPDGKKILFISYDYTYSRYCDESKAYFKYKEISVMDSDGHNHIKISDINTQDNNVKMEWSPDGTKIAFEAVKKYNFNNIFVINPDGNDEIQLTDIKDLYVSGVEWAFDSNNLFYKKSSSNNKSIELYKVKKDGSNKVYIGQVDNNLGYYNDIKINSKTDEITFSISNSIFYPSTQKLLSSSTINTVNKSVKKEIGKIERYQSNYIRYFEWSPDNKNLAFIAYTENGPESRYKYTSEVYITDNSGNQKLIYTGISIDSLAWSPDNTKLIFSSSSYKESNQTIVSNIYILNTKNSELEQITNNDNTSGVFSNISFSHDGTKIAFESNIDKGEITKASEIYVMNSDGTNIKRLTFGTYKDN